MPDAERENVIEPYLLTLMPAIQKKSQIPRHKRGRVSSITML